MDQKDPYGCYLCIYLIDDNIHYFNDHFLRTKKIKSIIIFGIILIHKHMGNIETSRKNESLQYDVVSHSQFSSRFKQRSHTLQFFLTK